jgi:hypothetical protein
MIKHAHGCYQHALCCVLANGTPCHLGGLRRPGRPGVRMFALHANQRHLYKAYVVLNALDVGAGSVRSAVAG